MKRDLSPDDYKINHLVNWLNKKYPEQLDYITIGQMIEFLIDNKDVPIVSHLIENYNSGPHGEPKFIDDGYIKEINPETWCDKLWEAVKEILRED